MKSSLLKEALKQISLNYHKLEESVSKITKDNHELKDKNAKQSQEIVKLTQKVDEYRTITENTVSQVSTETTFINNNIESLSKGFENRFKEITTEFNDKVEENKDNINTLFSSISSQRTVLYTTDKSHNIFDNKSQNLSQTTASKTLFSFRLRLE